MGNCCDRPVLFNEKNQQSKTSKNQVMAFSKNSDFRKTYEYLSILGSGAFAKVRLFRNIHYKNLKYAIKTLKKEGISKPLYDCIKLEVNILRRLDHPNIVKYYESFEDDVYLHIVMEYLEGDDLFTIISQRNHNKFTEKDMIKIMHQLFKALVFIHNKNIVHRDIKPENILFSQKDDYSTLKLIDFGLATTTMRKDKKSCGSPYYMSPEIINGRFCPKTDVWAAGVILFLMLTGKFPFQGNPNTGDIFDNIMKQEIPIDILKKSRCSSEAIDLVTKLLAKDDNERLSSEEALEHCWFTKYDSIKHTSSISMETVETLRDFSNKTIFQKEVLFFIAKIAKEEEIKQLKELFNQLDENNTGVLTINEIKYVFKKVGIKLSEEEMKDIWEGLDFHKDGMINYTEFLAGMISSVMSDKEEKLQSAFNYFQNMNDEGYISYDSLIKATKAFDLPVNTKEIKKTFDNLDEKEKRINFETFKKIINGN